MEQQLAFYPDSKAELYALLTRQLEALTETESNWISNFSNAASLLFYALKDINWAGFYLLDGTFLLLGPFQGKTACIRIPLGRGVCGTAAAENRIVTVPDVHKFPGHIACDSASESEIVLPIQRNGLVIGVLDIDSPSKNRFDEEDAAGLQQFVNMLEKSCGPIHFSSCIGNTKKKLSREENTFECGEASNG